jgi:hypothetical protein
MACFALVLAAVLLGTSGVAGALWDRVHSTTPLTITLLRIGFAIPFLLLITAIAGPLTSGHNSDVLRWA